MAMFRFGIMGAAKIARKFCDAVSRLEGCEVAAISARSLQRAEEFAEENQIARAYGSYREMLEKENLDCVYIAVLPHKHFELTMLCLDYNMSVLCEKAMFMNGKEAEAAFARAQRQNVFVMEAMWSRFLPAIQQAKKWIAEGKIGKIRYIDAAIGFVAPKDPENRYFNAELGGGAAHDITVYTYELATYMIDEPIVGEQISVVWGETGVDLINHVTLQFPEAVASLATSFVCPVEESMVICGEEGKIVIPRSHVTKQAFLYNERKELQEEFQDDPEQNGFVYEIMEVMECIRSGRRESEVASHDMTLNCSRLFDRIAATRG